jgi:beta-phosphoglucomutase-like phosphatase (HAD superfamily)
VNTTTPNSISAPVSPRWVIVDIDGTVALHVYPAGHERAGELLRHHHSYERVGEDLPNHHVIALVRSLAKNGFRIMFLSGRPERCGTTTRFWLSEHVGRGAGRAPLFMRRNRDNRGDEVVKPEMLNRAMAELGISLDDIAMAIDDRPKVIRAYQALGIKVIDVAPESGEF